MLARIAFSIALRLARVAAQSSESSETDLGTGTAVTLTGDNTASVTLTGGDYVAVTTGITYASNGDTITFTSTDTLYTRPTYLSDAIANATASSTNINNSTSTSPTQTLLVGGTATSSGNSTGGTGSSTTSAVLPENTVPCNGYPEFCTRSYSNITHVAAHNSPFTQPNNLASNQDLPVLSQLNDGVRMLQFQVHDLNGTLYMCHTSCDLLNAGTLAAYLTTVAEWLDRNPYDVITILIGNYDTLPPDRFVGDIETSGLLRYVYTPTQNPMALSDWPTLGSMILRQQRVVMMLDYNADQATIPYLLDEFSQMWETPFSPTERSFPCTVQRPPDQADDISRERMYMANHNLNLDVAIAGISLLIPASNLLNETNAVSGFGSAGAQITNCTTMWDRPPNFLLVDYYNFGNFNGSVFQVAADANGVTYQEGSCCDTNQRDFQAGAAGEKHVSTRFVIAFVALGLAWNLL